MPKALKRGILHIYTLVIYQDIPKTNTSYYPFKWNRHYALQNPLMQNGTSFWTVDNDFGQKWDKSDN